MQGNFSRCARIVLGHEGGEVNDPADPGGHTNLGVTQATLDRARRQTSLRLPKSVSDLSSVQAMSIYERLYWDRTHATELPTGVDLMVFDAAVNQGVRDALKFLQRAAGTKADGLWGPNTHAAVVQFDDTERLLRDIAAYRAKDYGSLKSRLLKRYGFGWYRRLLFTYETARAWL